MAQASLAERSSQVPQASTPLPAAGFSLLADDPARRATERFALAYSPVWIAVVALVMIAHLVDGWGEVGFLAFGVALAVPPWLRVLFPGRASPDAALPIAQRHVTRFALAVALCTFVQSWL